MGFGGLLPEAGPAREAPLQVPGAYRCLGSGTKPLQSIRAAPSAEAPAAASALGRVAPEASGFGIHFRKVPESPSSLP